MMPPPLNYHKTTAMIRGIPNWVMVLVIVIIMMLLILLFCLYLYKNKGRKSLTNLMNTFLMYKHFKHARMMSVSPINNEKVKHTIYFLELSRNNISGK